MKGQLRVATPAEYIAGVDEARRAEITELDGLIRELAPKLEPFIHSGMLGYGRMHYKYASGREGIGSKLVWQATRITYHSIFAPATARGMSPSSIKQELPKANIGKSCVRFKRLSDLDSAALQRLIRD